MMGNGWGSEGISRDQMDAEFRIKPAQRLPLTAECKHYTGRDEVPWDNQRYATA